MVLLGLRWLVVVVRGHPSMSGDLLSSTRCGQSVTMRLLPLSGGVALFRLVMMVPVRLVLVFQLHRRHLVGAAGLYAVVQHLAASLPLLADAHNVSLAAAVEAHARGIPATIRPVVRLTAGLTAFRRLSGGATLARYHLRWLHLRSGNSLPKSSSTAPSRRREMVLGPAGIHPLERFRVPGQLVAVVLAVEAATTSGRFGPLLGSAAQQIPHRF